MSKFELTEEIKTTISNWIHCFSGDAEVRCKDTGLVYLVCDGYFGQEQYVKELGVFDDPREGMRIISELIKSDPRSAVSPRNIVFAEIGKLAMRRGKR